MNKERRSKSLVIIALALTLIALTVGFAAFSITLNVVSNATVSPNQEDFKITIYGMKDAASIKRYQTSEVFDESMFSSTISYPAYDSTSTSAELATINNSTHTISNINVSFIDPGHEVIYYFAVKNEGKYDAYIDLTGYQYENGKYLKKEFTTGTCVPGEETTKALVEATCQNVVTTMTIVDNNGVPIETGEIIVIVPQNKYVILSFLVGYTEPETRADGPFSVSFADTQLSFSTTK